MSAYEDLVPGGRAPAIVYCEGAYRERTGKTAHGLVRYTERFRVLSVVDSTCAGNDAGILLDGKIRNIPIYTTISEAVTRALADGIRPAWLVIGLAPDGGRLAPQHRVAVLEAIRAGLNICSGLHDFLCDDKEMVATAEKHKVHLVDVRKPPPRKELHFFSGKIQEVTSFRVAVLGTDSAVGKRTAALILVNALRDLGYSAELIGTGQTSWMQGVRYGIILDSLINDFVAGELEHAVWTAWKECAPEFILIEGQGSLMNPAYPGGFEILAATRPQAVLVQHAPARREYDGFPGYPIHPLEKQIQAIELISDRRVVAVTVNGENLSDKELVRACEQITRSTKLPACDVTRMNPEPVLRAILDARTSLS